jgi:NADPH2:quinone reductase
MKAMVIVSGSAGAQLRWQEVPDPQPGPGELLVAVRAVGMNRADLLLRAGHYERIATKPPAPIAGLEAAGDVIALGEGVTDFRIGDRVMGMPSGAYAEKVLLHYRLALRVPAGFSWEEAAALPVALLTAHDGLVSNGSLARGETVLVQGATTGVGIVAMQIAKYCGASVVIGTSTSADKLARLAPYGIDVGIDTRREDFAQRVLEVTANRGADVILDMVGAGAVAGHLACAAVKARWVQVGRVSGAKAEIDLNELSRKRLRLIGVTFRTRSLDEFAGVVAAAERDLGAAVAARRIISPVDRVLTLDAACEAHAYMRSNALLGKIILKP